MTHLLSLHQTGQPVRRDSFDIEDPRAQVARPIPLGMAFVDAITETLAEWDEYRKGIGLPYEFGLSGRLVLRALLRCTDFKTGICEPSIDTLQRMTKLARATVVRSLKLLFRDGFINWVRRTCKTGAAPGQGPAVKQVSNAYFFDTSRLHKRCLMRLREKLRQKGKVFKEAVYPRFPGLVQRRKETIRDQSAYKRACFRNARTAEEQVAILYPGDEAAQREHLAMLTGASSTDGLNPPPSRSIQKE